MKKTIIFLALLSFFTVAMQAQNKSFIFSAEALSGYTDGVINEILYHSGSIKDTKASLLEWQKKFFFAGAALTAEYKRFSTGVNFTTAVHKGFGQMKDSDWMNESATDIKTTYSTGDTETKENYNTVFFLQYDLIKSKTISFFPQLQLQYAYDSFSRGTSAKGWYGNKKGIYDSEGRLIDIVNENNPVAWNSPDAVKVPYDRWNEATNEWKHGYLKGINYSQHQLYTWAGFGINVQPVRQLNLKLLMFVSPYSYFSAADHHNGQDYTRHMIQQKWLASYKMEGQAVWSINRYISFSLKASFSATPEFRGENYNDWYLDKYQDSGIEVYSKTVTAGFRLSI